MNINNRGSNGRVKEIELPIRIGLICFTTDKNRVNIFVL